MALDMLKRSIELMVGSTINQGKQYMTNVTQLVEDSKQVASNIKDNVRAPIDFIRQMNTKSRGGGLYKTVSDWFYQRAEDYDQYSLDNIDDDDFDSGMSAGGSDDEPTPPPSLNVESMKNIARGQVGAMYQIGKKQVEAGLANTAEIVTSLNTRTTEITTSINNMNKTILAINNNLTKIVNSLVQPQQRNDYSSYSDDSDPYHDGKLTLGSFAKAASGSISNNSFVEIGKMLLGAAKEGGPSVLTDMLVQHLADSIKIGEKTISEHAESLNTALGNAMHDIFSGIMNSSFFKDIFGDITTLTRDFSPFIKSDYNNKKAVFDGMTRKTIVEIIPEYLKKITQALTGEVYNIDKHGKLTDKTINVVSEHMEGVLTRSAFSSDTVRKHISDGYKTRTNIDERTIRQMQQWLTQGYVATLYYVGDRNLTVSDLNSNYYRDSAINFAWKAFDKIYGKGKHISEDDFFATCNDILDAQFYDWTNQHAFIDEIQSIINSLQRTAIKLSGMGENIKIDDDFFINNTQKFFSERSLKSSVTDETREEIERKVREEYKKKQIEEWKKENHKRQFSDEDVISAIVNERVSSAKTDSTVEQKQRTLYDETGGRSIGSIVTDIRDILLKKTIKVSIQGSSNSVRNVEKKQVNTPIVCSNCGEINKPDSTYCKQCGYELKRNDDDTSSHKRVKVRRVGKGGKYSHLNLNTNGCGPIALNDLAERMYGDGDYDPNYGTSVEGYINSASNLGIKLHPERVTNDSLRGASGSHPITVLGSGYGFGTKLGQNHFMNIVGYDGDNVYTSNPMYGNGRYPIGVISNNSILGLFGRGSDDAIEEMQKGINEVNKKAAKAAKKKLRETDPDSLLGKLFKAFHVNEESIESASEKVEKGTEKVAKKGKAAGRKITGIMDLLSMFFNDKKEEVSNDVKNVLDQRIENQNKRAAAVAEGNKYADNMKQTVYADRTLSDRDKQLAEQALSMMQAAIVDGDGKADLNSIKVVIRKIKNRELRNSLESDISGIINRTENKEKVTANSRIGKILLFGVGLIKTVFSPVIKGAKAAFTFIKASLTRLVSGIATYGKRILKFLLTPYIKSAANLKESAKGLGRGLFGYKETNEDGSVTKHKGLFGSIAELPKSILGDIGSVVKTVGKAIAEKLDLGGIKLFFANIGKNIRVKFGIIGANISLWWNKFKDDFKEKWALFKAGVKQVGSKIKGIFGKIGEGLAAVGKWFGKLGKNIAKLAASIATGAKKLWTSFKSTRIGSALTKAGGAVKTWVGGAFKTTVGSFFEGYNEVKNASAAAQTAAVERVFGSNPDDDKPKNLTDKNTKTLVDLLTDIKNLLFAKEEEANAEEETEEDIELELGGGGDDNKETTEEKTEEEQTKTREELYEEAMSEEDDDERFGLREHATSEETTGSNFREQTSEESTSEAEAGDGESESDSRIESPSRTKGTLGSIFKSVGRIAAGVTGIYGSIGKIVVTAAMQLAGFKTLMNLLKTIVTNAIQPIGDFLSEIVDAIKPIVGTLTSALTDLVNAAVEIMSVLFETLVPFLEPLFNVVTDIFTAVGSDIIAAIGGIVKLLSPLLKTVLEVLVPVIKAAHGVLETVVGAIMYVVGKVLYGIGWLVSKVSDKIGGGLESAGNKISASGSTKFFTGLARIADISAPVIANPDEVNQPQISYIDANDINGEASSEANGGTTTTTTAVKPDEAAKSDTSEKTGLTDSDKQFYMDLVKDLGVYKIYPNAVGKTRSEIVAEYSPEVADEIYNNIFDNYGSKAALTILGSGDSQVDYGYFMNMKDHGCGPVALADAINRRKLGMMYGSGDYIDPAGLTARMYDVGMYDTNRGTSVRDYLTMGNALGYNMTAGGVDYRSLKQASPTNPITLVGSGSGFGTKLGNNHYINVLGPADTGYSYVSNPLTGRVSRAATGDLIAHSKLGIYGSGPEEATTTTTTTTVPTDTTQGPSETTTTVPTTTTAAEQEPAASTVTTLPENQQEPVETTVVPTLEPIDYGSTSYENLKQSSLYDDKRVEIEQYISQHDLSEEQADFYRKQSWIAWFASHGVDVSDKAEYRITGYNTTPKSESAKLDLSDLGNIDFSSESIASRYSFSPTISTLVKGLKDIASNFLSIFQGDDISTEEGKAKYLTRLKDELGIEEYNKLRAYAFVKFAREHPPTSNESLAPGEFGGKIYASRFKMYEYDYITRFLDQFRKDPGSCVIDNSVLYSIGMRDVKGDPVDAVINFLGGVTSELMDAVSSPSISDSGDGRFTENGVVYEAKNFTPRLTIPEDGNKFYNTKSNGGISDYPSAASLGGALTIPKLDLLANCSGYAYGRFHEEINDTNNTYFHGGTDYPRNGGDFVKTGGKQHLDVETSNPNPRPGDAISWTDSNNPSGGHVAIIEEVSNNGNTITISHSGFTKNANKGGFKFKTMKINRDSTGGFPLNWTTGDYHFYGIAHNPDIDYVKANNGTPMTSVNGKITHTDWTKKYTEFNAYNSDLHATYRDAIDKSDYHESAVAAGLTPAEEAYVAAVGIHENSAKKLVGVTPVTKVTSTSDANKTAFGIFNWKAVNPQNGNDYTYGKNLTEQLASIKKRYFGQNPEFYRARILKDNYSGYSSALKTVLNTTQLKLQPGESWGGYLDSDLRESTGHGVGNAIVPGEWSVPRGHAIYIGNAIDYWNYMVDKGYVNPSETVQYDDRGFRINNPTTTSGTGTVSGSYQRPLANAGNSVQWVTLTRPGSSGYDYNSGSNEENIYRYLVQEKGMTGIGAAGMMGCMKYESGFMPNNLENSYNTRFGLSDEEYTQRVNNGTESRNNFIYGRYATLGKWQKPGEGVGYGLTQFTSSSLKRDLYDNTVSKGKSIADIPTQLDCTVDTLKSSKYNKQSLFNAINNSATPTRANQLFLWRYEAGTGFNSDDAVLNAYSWMSRKDINNRHNAAEKFYKQYKGTYGGGDTSELYIPPVNPNNFLSDAIMNADSQGSSVNNYYVAKDSSEDRREELTMLLNHTFNVRSESMEAILTEMLKELRNRRSDRTPVSVPSTGNTQLFDDNIPSQIERLMFG